MFHARRSLLLLIENRQKSSGMILLLSLLMSFILAFALSIELLNTRLNRKNFSLNLQRNELFYAVEKNKLWALNTLNSGLHDDFCFFSESFPDDYAQQLRQKKLLGCTKKINNITLHAVVEDMKVISYRHIYRVSLFGEDSRNNQLTLQTVVAVHDKTTQQMSWRMVPNF